MPNEEATLELRDYLRVLRRWKWTIAVVVLLAIGVAVGMAVREKPLYTTYGKVLLARRLVDQLFIPTADAQGADNGRTQANEIEVMSSPPVRDSVAKLLGRAPASVDFAALPNTDVVLISSSSPNAKLAAKTVNAYAKTYIDVRTNGAVSQLQEASNEIQSQIGALDAKIGPLETSLAADPPVPVNGIIDSRVTDRGRFVAQRNSYVAQLDKLQTGITVAQHGGAEVLADAAVPTTPTNQDLLRNGLAGLVIGLVLGIALAFLREYLDDTVKTKDDLERASGLTVLGLIPTLGEWKNRSAPRLISMSQPRSPAAEAYRTVRTSIEFLSLDQQIGSLQVTSGIAAEGKTTTLANLATTFARAGQRVIVLCCDMRRPRVHEFFGLENKLGFTSVLLGDASITDAIQRVPGELAIGLVSSGPIPPNPAELLESQRAADTIEALDNRCDLLLIDSPPVLPVTDALVIAGLVDGVLLVGDSGRTTKRGLKRAVELLRQVDAPLIGAMLNDVHSKSDYGYAYGYSDSQYYDYRASEGNGQPTGNGADKARKRSRVPH